jgi:hypothetical protein
MPKPAANDGYRVLASEIIRQGVDDYRLIAENGFIRGGSFHSKPLASIDREIKDWEKIKKALKTLSYRGVVVSKYANMKMKKRPEWPLGELSLTEAQSAISFFRCPEFVGLCRYVGVCPDAVRDRLKALGCRVATRRRQKARPSRLPS